MPSFSSLLTDFNILVLTHAGALVLGVLFSQKIKDYIKGVPAQARVALNNVEADAVAKLRAAQADVLAKLPGAVPAAKVALAPAAPTAPVAPAPAAQPAAPAQSTTIGALEVAQAAAPAA